MTFASPLLQASDPDSDDKPDSPFELKQYQWKNRILVVSAQSIDDENLKLQQSEIATSLEEFADRDMVLVTLLDDAVSTAADRTLTSEETASVRDALRFSPGVFSAVLIGKDGQAKLAKNSAISMNEIYALIDTMPMRRRETLER